MSSRSKLKNRHTQELKVRVMVTWIVAGLVIAYLFLYSIFFLNNFFFFEDAKGNALNNNDHVYVAGIPGLSKKEYAGIITAGPNPVVDYSYVAFKADENSSVNLQIVNSKGEILYRDSLEAIKGINHYKFRDVSNLTPGQYFIHLVKKGETIDDFEITKK